MKNYELEKKNIALAYSQKAPSYNSGKAWRLKDGSNIDNFLSKLSKGGKILSLGSGRGEMEGYIAGKDFNVTGVDISKVMVDLASKEFPNAEFIHQDVDNLDFSDSSFDAVISRYMSQHVQLDLLIKKMASLTKNGGLIWLMLHTALNESEEIEFGWDEVHIKAKMWLPSNAEVEKLIVSQKQIEVLSVREYPERSQRMNDLLYVIKIIK